MLSRTVVISDIDFILQLVEQVAPVIDNIRLVDRLASDAAEEERRRLARTIHDSVIQNYLGLQTGLTALRHRIESGANVIPELDQLTKMTENGVADLRRFVLGLGEPGKHEGSLLPAVRRFAARFSETTGFSVSIEASEDILISDRLAAEAFQMVVEGLSNIRRHTQAVHAKLSFACRDDHLFIGIENDSPGGHAPAHFTPRSISERAKALGGEARVDVREDGRTLVEIAIPL